MNQKLCRSAPPRSRVWGGVPLGGIALIGSAAVLLAFSAPARAVTGITVEGRTQPVTLAIGEIVSVHFDVAKAGGTINLRLSRDLGGEGPIRSVRSLLL